MKHIIHIGPPKTGTTSIQEMLAQEEPRLSAAGVHYLNAYRVGPSHNALAMAIRRKEADDARVKIARELERSDADTAIFSSELFFTPFVGARLPDALPPEVSERPTMIAYLRRHDLYFESVFKQRLKTGHAAVDPLEFLASQKPGVYLFDRALRMTCGAFTDPTVIVREYDRKALREGNVVADFAHETGLLDRIPDLKLDFESNPSTSYAVCRALGEIEFASKAELRKVLRKMTRENPEGLNRSRDVLSLEQREELLDKWSDDNAQLAQSYTPDRAGFFNFDLSNDKGNYMTDAERAEALDWARAYVRDTARAMNVAITEKS